MSVYATTHFLRDVATREEIESIPEGRFEPVLNRILDSTPTEERWKALVELFAILNDAESVRVAVAAAGPRVLTWPWRIRKLELGHKATLGPRKPVLTLVGHLEFQKAEDLSGRTIRGLAEDPCLENLRGLTLFKIESYPRYIHALAESPYLNGLEFLELKKLDLARGIGEALQGNGLAGLRELHLQGNNLSAADYSALASVPLARRLEHLDLSGNSMRGGGLALVLAASSFPRMKVLDLSHSSVSAKKLEEALQDLDHPALQIIILKGTGAADSLGERWVRP
jgi:hypothetical protein